MTVEELKQVCLDYGFTIHEQMFKVKFYYKPHSSYWNRKEYAGPSCLVNMELYSNVVFYDEFFENKNGIVLKGCQRYKINDVDIEELTKEDLISIINSTIKNFKNYEQKMKLNSIEQDF